MLREDTMNTQQRADRNLTPQGVPYLGGHHVYTVYKADRPYSSIVYTVLPMLIVYCFTQHSILIVYCFIQNSILIVYCFIQHSILIVY